MAVEIRVPSLGESVTEATVGQWFKKEGEAVVAEEPLVALETDKVTVEVPAPASGTLSEISVNSGDTVEIGAVLGAIIEGKSAAKAAGQTAAASPAARPAAAPAVSPKPAAAPAAAMPPSPAAGKMMADQGLAAGAVEGTGKRGQVLKEDVMRAIDAPSRPASTAPATASASPVATASQPVAEPSLRLPPAPQVQNLSYPPQPRADYPQEERVRMTRLRQTIARRLKDAQNSAAMLTTFNEVDMTAVMALREEYKDLFLKKHGVKLGFMGFFVKAAVTALKEIPEVNAEIDGTDIVYKNYYHIGVAVGTDTGLVVPVVRDAGHLSLAGIEAAITQLAQKARDGRLAIEDMMGGTFTITNGGVYGSLMSTPILNAPQSGILGMHKIEQRPVVIGKDIVARPMMYIALSYDHRIVDGKQAVTFLVRVKESIEDPKRLILDL